MIRLQTEGTNHRLAAKRQALHGSRAIIGRTVVDEQDAQAVVRVAVGQQAFHETGKAGAVIAAGN